MARVVGRYLRVPWGRYLGTWPGGRCLGQRGTYPPIGTWLGGRYLGQGVGTLGYPNQDLAGGRYLGIPPLPCGQTDTCENSTSPSYYVRGR